MRRGSGDSLVVEIAPLEERARGDVLSRRQHSIGPAALQRIERVRAAGFRMVLNQELIQTLGIRTETVE